MALFTIRVELHNASAEQYITLHERMKAFGAKRHVDGKTASGEPGIWQLPSAEYDFSSEQSAAEVRDAVKLIADSVKTGAWVLVTKVAERSWSTQRLPANS